MSDNWPTLFSEAQNNEVPAETFARVDEGEDFGWPYCYFDAAKGEHVLAPEYGGDGTRIGDCGSKAMPDLTFPAIRTLASYRLMVRGTPEGVRRPSREFHELNPGLLVFDSQRQPLA